MRGTALLASRIPDMSREPGVRTRRRGPTRVGARRAYRYTAGRRRWGYGYEETPCGTAVDHSAGLPAGPVVPANPPLARSDEGQRRLQVRNQGGCRRCVQLMGLDVGLQFL